MSVGRGGQFLKLAVQLANFDLLLLNKFLLCGLFRLQRLVRRRQLSSPRVKLHEPLAHLLVPHRVRLAVAQRAVLLLQELYLLPERPQSCRLSRCLA